MKAELAATQVLVGTVVGTTSGVCGVDVAFWNDPATRSVIAAVAIAVLTALGKYFIDKVFPNFNARPVPTTIPTPKDPPE